MDLEVKTVVVDGVKGTFIAPASMNRITFVLTECVPTYKALIEGQARLLDLHVRHADTSSKSIAAAIRLAAEEHDRGEHWKQAYAGEHDMLLEERASSNSVFRSPVFWLAVGVVVGAGATIGIAFAYKQAVGVQ